MKKFERHTLLVSGGHCAARAEKPERGGCFGPGISEQDPGPQGLTRPLCRTLGQDTPLLQSLVLICYKRGDQIAKGLGNRTKLTVVIVSWNGEGPQGRVRQGRKGQPARALTWALARPPGIPPWGGGPEPACHAAPGRCDVRGRLLLSQLCRGPAGPQLPQRPAPVRGGA